MVSFGKVTSSYSLRPGLSVSRLNLMRTSSPNSSFRKLPSFGSKYLSCRHLGRANDHEFSFRSLPVQDAYGKEDPAFIGMLKGDILAVRGKIDDIRGKPDSEASELIRTIAKYTTAEDLQAEMQARLFLLEVRDNQMCQLEALLNDRLSAMCPETPRSVRGAFFSPRPNGSRAASYLAIVDLLLAFAMKFHEMRQSAREREALVVSMDSQLRSLLTALETQNAQLQVLQKASQGERDRLDAAHWAVCVERDAAQASATQLRLSVGTLEESKRELESELSWFRNEHDRLRRECSYLGMEMETLAQPEEPQRYMSSRIEFCDRCPALDAQCNSLRQENQELQYILHRTKQDHSKLFGEARELEKKLESERKRRQELSQDFQALAGEHRLALANLDWQENLILTLRDLLADLTCGSLLQAEAGERLALAHQEEADMHHILSTLWHHKSRHMEAELGSLSLEEDQQEWESAQAAREDEVRQLRQEVQHAAAHAAQLQARLQASASADHIDVAAALQAQLVAALQKFDSLPRSPFPPRGVCPVRH